MKVPLTIGDFLRRGADGVRRPPGRHRRARHRRAPWARSPTPSWRAGPGGWPSPSMTSAWPTASGWPSSARTPPGSRSPSSGSAATAGSWSRSTTGSNAEEIRYIIEHSGATVLLVDPESRRRPARTSRPSTASCWTAAGRPAHCSPRPPAGAEPAAWDARRGRHRQHQLHQRDHGPAQGRPAHPPQLLAQRRHLRLAHVASPTGTCSCTRCRCSTATAGACRTPSPAWACPRSWCARSTARRSCAASRSTA